MLNKAILNSICWLQIQDANVPFLPNPKGALVEWDLAITEASSELIDMSKKNSLRGFELWDN